MIYRSQANCLMCAHYSGERHCRAFPNGIPNTLWIGENLHREPYPGDEGVRFQPKQVAIPVLEDILPEAVYRPEPHRHVA